MAPFPNPILARPEALEILALVLGLVVGSFLNVVIHRLPRMMERDWQAQCAQMNDRPPEPVPRYNLAVPGSACPGCGHPISILENIPVVSFLALRGRCSACRIPIGIRYPLVELLTGLLFAAAAWRFGFSLAAGGAMLLLAALIALTFIDLDTQYLPDSITLPLIWSGLLINIPATFVDLPAAVIGAAAGYLVLWSVYWAFKLATGKEGMGYGDFKLLAALGAWMGWKVLPFIILASSAVGAVIGIGLIVLARRGREVPMPFGPYLAIAGALSLFFGGPIVGLYFGFLG
jgi:leader peptidase (prepilin peptidase)/N-methyltransferase